MEMHDRIVGNAAQEYIIDSNEALAFKLVRTATDMEREDGSFHPDMTHQIYGDGEQIFGYRDLSVTLYCTAGRLNMYCDVQHSGKMKKNKPEELEPDDVITPLSSLVPPNTILDNRDTFVALLRKETTFRPFGEQVYCHTNTSADNCERTFEIYLSNESTPGFVDYFERLQMFTMFYVDAASYIDCDDPKWKYFLAFEKYKSSDGSALYAIVGFATVYEFYGYPEHVRPRIAQMLVLPPFQRMGVATAMLQSVYQQYISNPKVLTIAVEDPSAVFTSMRLVMDCRNCIKIPLFSVKHVKKGITKEHYDTGRDKLKLSKENVRSVFNVLRMRVTDRSNPEDYKNFRLFIKNQLYFQFRRQDKDIAKLQRYNMTREEIIELVSFVPKEKRSDLIHQEYLDMEAKLLAIVAKLPSLSPEEIAEMNS